MIVHSKDTTGAFPDGNKHWHSINWVQSYKTVQRLQTRIVKATHDSFIKRSETVMLGSKHRAFKRLEPYDGKLSSTVLRGRRRRKLLLCYPTIILKPW